MWWEYELNRWPIFTYCTFKLLQALCKILVGNTSMYDMCFQNKGITEINRIYFIYQKYYICKYTTGPHVCHMSCHLTAVDAQRGASFTMSISLGC